MGPDYFPISPKACFYTLRPAVDEVYRGSAGARRIYPFRCRPASSVLASELDHRPIGFGAEQQLLDIERLIGFVGKVKIAQSVVERWNAHGTCANVGVGTPPEHDGGDLDPYLNESLLDVLQMGSSGGVAQALRKSS
jgi:hypothetical protein